MSDNKDNVLHYFVFCEKNYLTRVKSEWETVPLGEGQTRIACIIARKATHGVLLLYFQHT